MQKVLNVSTPSNSIRADIYGCGYEDGDLVKEYHGRYSQKYHYLNFPVGLVGAPKFPLYPTVLHAIGDGWKLLAPPQETTWTNSDGEKIPEWSWWLVKD